jgi:hypothetical protein
MKDRKIGDNKQVFIFLSSIFLSKTRRVLDR